MTAAPADSTCHSRRPSPWLLCLLPCLCLLAAPPAAGEPREPERQYLFARGLLSRGFNELAATEFRVFIEQHPAHELAPQAARGLIKALQNAGAAEPALLEIEKVRQTYPDHPVASEILLDKGYLLLTMKRPAEAIAALAPLTTQPTTQLAEAALYFTAQAHQQNGAPAPAMAIYQTLADRPFDPAHTYRPYAAYAVLAANLPAGGRQTRPLLDKLLAGEAVPPTLLLQALLLFADTTYRRNELDDAGWAYATIRQNFPDQPASATARLGELRIAHRHAPPREVVRLAQELRAQEGWANNPEVNFILAAALYRLEQYAAATPLLAAVASQTEAWPELRLQAGMLHLQALLGQNQHAALVDAAQAFRQRHPQTAESLEAAYLQGLAEIELERHAAAVDTLRQALAAGPPALPAARRNEALALLTVPLAKLEHHDQAADLHRQLAGQPPFDEQRANHLLAAANAYQQAKMVEAARDAYQTAWQGAPTTAAGLAAANALVRLDYQAGNFAAAVATLQEISRRTDGEEWLKTQLTLAYALLANRQPDAATVALRAALDRQPVGKLAAEIRFALVKTELKLNRVEAAIAQFRPLWELTEDDRPDLDTAVLLRLQQEFFLRHDYATSEKLCRHLLEKLPADESFPPALRLAEILVATARLDEARDLLDQRRRQASASQPPNHPRLATIDSLLGEIHLAQGRLNLAFRAFEATLEHGGDNRSVARARWGLATLLRQEQRLDDALRQAVGAFVLLDDPLYTPKAMLMASDILAEQGKQAEAEATRKEMRLRYPAFADQHLPPPGAAQ